MIISMARVLAGLGMLCVACSGAPGPVDVDGLVLDARGFPQPNALVSVAGRPAVRTSADGTFSFARVQPPYDVLASADAIGPVRAAAWLGLSRADPLLVLGDSARQERQAVACGTISGMGSPAERTLAVMTHAAGFADFITGATADGQFCTGVGWFGATAVQTRVQVLEIEYDASVSEGSLVKSITGYGTAPLSVSDQDQLQGVQVALSPVPTNPLRLSISASSGSTLESASALLSFDPSLPSTRGVALADRFTPGAFQVPFPSIPGALVRVDVLSNDPAGGGRVVRTFDAAGSWSGEPPAGPRLLQPSDGAALAAGLRFAWAASDGLGVHQLSLQQTSGETLLHVDVTTSANEVVLPDFAAVGVALPAEAFFWSVQGFGSGSVDELTTPAQSGVFYYGIDPPGADWRSSFSTNRALN
jgi:hypothetical protein